MNGLSKFTILVMVICFLYLCAVSYTLGNLWAFKESTEQFIEEQHKLNTSITRVMAKMAAAIDHNYEFNKSNKEFIQNVAEIYVPDEVALLREIPAPQ